MSEDGGGGDGAGNGPSGPIDRRMLEAIVCPVTQAPLSYNAEKQELVSKAAHLAYPIRGGIPIMLEEEARKLD